MKSKITFIQLILISIGLGVIVGFVLPGIAVHIKVIGTIFLRLMQATIPLLVLGQVIQALGDIDGNELSRIGLRTIAIFLISSLMASFWGMFFAQIFKPGLGVNGEIIQGTNITPQSIDVTQTITDFFPNNIMNSLANGSVIQIIVFALIFGFALNRYNQTKPGNLLIKFIQDFNEVIMKTIELVMKIAPIGVFALMASTIASTGLSVIIPVLKYIVVYGLATFLFLILWIIIVSVYCKVSIKSIIKGVKDMSIFAMSTISSAVTFPLALKDTKEKLQVSDKVADLVLPLGVSLNSNGAAMHIAITVITVMQLYGMPLDLPMMIYIGVLSMFVSLANAVVPGASLVSLAIIFPQLGLPLESIALFAGVDYFVGMLRTVLNVDSDVFSAMLVAKSIDELGENADRYFDYK